MPNSPEDFKKPAVLFNNHRSGSVSTRASSMEDGCLINFCDPVIFQSNRLAKISNSISKCSTGTVKCLDLLDAEHFYSCLERLFPSSERRFLVRPSANCEEGIDEYADLVICSLPIWGCQIQERCGRPLRDSTGTHENSER